MLKVQEWLDQEYPESKRESITKLDLRNKDLEGELVIENWPNLERLDCGFNQITSIKISNLPKLNFFSARNCQLSNLIVENCPKIGHFNVKKNSLSDPSFINNLSSEKLIFLDIGNNSFPSQDLLIFSKLINLEELYFGNSFQGSLEPLKGLTRLKSLGIFSPNIDSGLEYLTINLEKIYLHSEKESDKSLEILEELKKYSIKDKYEFICYDYQNWRENNAERIELVNIDKVILFRQVKELQERINYLEKQKSNLEGLLEKNLSSISIGSVSLYSGDIITLQTENGKYLKRVVLSDKGMSLFSVSPKTNIQISDSNSPDEFSYFLVEIVEGNKVRLRTPSGNLYWKVLRIEDKESSISFVDDPDESTLLLINCDENDNKITLQLVNNKKKYLRLGSDNKSIIAKEKGGDRSIFLLNKENDYQKSIEGYREVIEDVKFHVEKKKESSKQSAQELTQKNQGSEPQKYILGKSWEYTQENTYDWGIELSAGVETGVKTGVPLVVEGEMTLKIEAKVSSGRSYTQSKTESLSGTLEVTCPGNSIVVAKAVLQEHNVEIPITTTIARYLTDRSGNERKYTYKVNGTFRGKYAKAFVDYEKAVPLTTLESQIEQLPK